MNIREFCNDLLKIYDEMSLVFSSAQNQSNLKCPSDCGKCCKNPNIEATVLEMLPMALYLHDQGLIDIYLAKINQSMESDLFCVGINQNRCDMYKFRPSVCRMFGVSAYIDKHQKSQATICRTLKELYPQDALKIKNSPENSDLPIMSHWSTRLLTLDSELLSRPMHINLALKFAIEKLELHLSYEECQNVR